MFAANKILSETQSILQGTAFADVSVALKLNTTIARPADQEVFAATSWRTGNTGRTKKLDYNNRFQM